MLSGEQEAFLLRRASLRRWWPIAGGGMLVLIGGFAVALWRRTPLMINPYAAMEAIREERIEEGTLVLLAVMTPVLLLLLLALLCVVVVFGFAVFANERRYATIIDALRAGQD